jgi:ankyrin repeat protein
LHYQSETYTINRKAFIPVAKVVFPIYFIRHVDKQNKQFWETCSFVREDNLEKVKEQLQQHPTHLHEKTANGITLLYFSKSTTMTSFLIEQGISIHETDEWGNTPLHLAAYEAFNEAVLVYLQNGAKIDAENRWGQKPHQLATTPATCDLFVKNRQNAQRRLDDSLQHISFYDAAKQGKENAIRYMLASGVDPNLLNHEDFQVDYWEDTPLHKAIYIGYHRIVELLLQYGANPNVHRGVSLYRSVYNTLTAKALHKYGAKATPDQLDQACWEAVVNVGNHALLQEFISYGAPLDKNYIIHDAIRRPDQTTEEHPKIIKTLVQRKPDLLEFISNIDETPLLKAVDIGNPLIVETLIELGADINKTNKLGVSPLLQAIRRRNTTMIQWLIENGASVTTVDKVGLSPYTRAVFLNQTTIVELLENTLQQHGLPVPAVALPPHAHKFAESTEHHTHFFHDDDWNDAVFIRWNQDKFLDFSHRLGFCNRYFASSDTTADKITYFFAREELLMQNSERNDDMFVTQYFAFHPDYPDAWMMYINWWNEESDVDYTQFHFRCPNELISQTHEAITEKDLIKEYSNLNLDTSEEHPILFLYQFSLKCLQNGLTHLWETPFYANKKENKQ